MTHIYKIFSLLVLLCTSQFINSQNRIGQVLNKSNNDPIEYATVVIKNTDSGIITNEDGIFIIQLTGRDTLLVSSLGFAPVEIFPRNEGDTIVVYLEEHPHLIAGIDIYSDSDYLYNILHNCRKRLFKRNYDFTSKSYYFSETESNGLVLEAEEYYYNARFNNGNLSELYYKNGRYAFKVAKEKDYQFTYFSSASARAIKYLDLINPNIYFPIQPLQLNKRNCCEQFDLRLLYSTENYMVISFSPCSHKDGFFEGEIWIEKETFNIMKLILRAEKTNVHPFLPKGPSQVISPFNLEVIQYFNNIDGYSIPVLLEFDYSYQSKKGYIPFDDSIQNTHHVSSFIHYYDFSNPFDLPFFNTKDPLFPAAELFIPYNSVFWENHSNHLLTNKQVKSLNELIVDNSMIDLKDYNRTWYLFSKNSSEQTQSNCHYKRWSSERRLKVTSNSKKESTIDQIGIESLSLNKRGRVQNELEFQRFLFNLNVQIFLDPVRAADSIYTVSYVILDPKDTYFNLVVDEYSQVFINIYYDLYEIERREMQRKLNFKIDNIKEIEAIYQETLAITQSITQQYLNEVNLGKNKNALVKWNSFVKGKLNIDNIAILMGN